HHAFSSGAGRTSDGNGSHWSTSKTPSYTKSVSWQHHRTAEGKTSAEIAMILSISENTVNFHQKNMQKKINAPNKTQVACYAAATGLI
ncbi:LuxR C-terminal-related transcriptional regulator, partial [Escherichia sp. AP1800]|uniref:LuxR C-terminal-related transcriptional regulator n=1 Tax=Escherichia sp. AP1800 TaxID=3381949 RepID=UPI00396F4721